MADFLAEQLSLATKQTGPEWLAELRDAGQRAFSDAQLPTRKTEAWKYTSLYNLSNAGLANAAPVAQGHYPIIPGLNGLRLVVCNGVPDTSTSDPEAMELVVRFADADAEQQQAILAQLGKTLADKGNLFSDLNTAALSEGYFLNVAKNHILRKPLHIIYCTTPTTGSGDEKFTVNTRLLVNLQSGSSATVIEHFSGEGEQNNFTNAVTEICVGDNAELTHYRLQLMSEGAYHISNCHIDLQRDARYSGFHLALGTALTRNDIVVNHNVGGSHCELNGVYVPQNKQLVDFHSNIEHKVANCTTEEVFRGIMNDSSKAVFNGRIHIHPQAQKTLAELSNKNLLLTNKAEINTKPELEIYADDVKCAHGATVAQLEEKATFYLQSRGISKEEAEVMLSFGFINELLDGLDDEAIGAWLRPQLAQRFGRDDALTAHIGGDL